MSLKLIDEQIKKLILVNRKTLLECYERIEIAIKKEMLGSLEGIGERISFTNLATELQNDIAIQEELLQLRKEHRIPEGWKLVPVRLTAENGMKAKLIGEFKIPHTVYTLDEEGEEEVESHTMIDVPWTTIKEIYAKAIDLSPEFPSIKE